MVYQTPGELNFIYYFQFSVGVDDWLLFISCFLFFSLLIFFPFLFLYFLLIAVYVVFSIHFNVAICLYNSCMNFRIDFVQFRFLLISTVHLCILFWAIFFSFLFNNCNICFYPFSEVQFVS